MLFFGQKIASLQFSTLFHLRSGAQFDGAQSVVGQFVGGQYAGETANWAPESEDWLTGPSTPTVIDRPVPELGEVGSRTNDVDVVDVYDVMMTVK